MTELYWGEAWAEAKEEVEVENIDMKCHDTRNVIKTIIILMQSMSWPHVDNNVLCKTCTSTFVKCCYIQLYYMPVGHSFI